MSTSAERRARNEAIFRQANEAIRGTQSRFGVSLPLVPFVCECPDTSCRQLLRLPLAAYEAVRAHPDRFVVAPGHEQSAPTVERGDGWCVVEKTGREAEVARATDPRSRAS